MLTFVTLTTSIQFQGNQITAEVVLLVLVVSKIKN
jgi:hypothetical protein